MLSMKRRKRNCRNKLAEEKSVTRFIRPAVFVTAFVVLVILGGGLWSWGTIQLQNSFELKTVRVEGRFEQVSAAQVRDKVSSYAGKGFFDIDVQQIKEDIQQMPWVAAVDVWRVWPDALAVTVSEKQAVARWGDEGLVTQQGEIFYPQPEALALELLQGLPQLHGQKNTEKEMLERFYASNKLMRGLGLQVAHLSFDRRRAWRMQLNNGLEVLLGRQEGLRRVKRFVLFYPTLLATRVQEAGVIDMRYPNGFAIKWSVPQDADARINVG